MRGKAVETKLEDEYKDSLVFAEVNGQSNIVCFRNMAEYIINNKWYESRREDSSEDAHRIITTAAKLIMDKIREHEYRTAFYPLQKDILSKKKNGTSRLEVATEGSSER